MSISGEPTMLRSVRGVLLTLCCVLALTSCDDSGTKPTSPPITPTPSSPSPTPTVPTYLADLTEEQRAAYAAAVSAYKAFGERQAVFFAEGKATPAARRYYREATADWQSYWARLRSNQRLGIQIQGTGTTLRTRPGAIRVGNAGDGRATLRVCGVAEGVTVTQHGSPVPQPTPRATVTRVSMVLLPDEAVWRVLSERVGSSC